MVRKYKKSLALCLKAGALLASMSSGYGRAYAGSCVGAGGTYLCSGAITSTKNLIVPGFLTVTTASGFGINTAAGNAFYLSAYGSGLTFLDSHASSITGAASGIVALNYGSGALSITTSGTVTGLSGTGIDARDFANGTDLTISTANVTGATAGILALNFGSGALSISSSGLVAATNGNGIMASNASTNGGDLTISTAEVAGTSYGIAALNAGAGALSITSSGTVAGVTGFGIGAINYGTDLTITTANVTGVGAGSYFGSIFAINKGSGELSISSSGTVEATSGIAIMAANYPSSSGNLTISTAEVTGTIAGIYAFNAGAGALSITSSGTVAGSAGVGIGAQNGGSDLTIMANNVYGVTHGIAAMHAGSGALSITTSGTVSGSAGRGIYAMNNGSQPTTITVGTQSIVLGQTAGIQIASTPGKYATINVFGEVRNLSDPATGNAIVSTDGRTTVNLFAGSSTTGSVSLGNSDDTFIQTGSSTLTGTANGGGGIDTLGFNNMGPVEGSLVGTKYLNFENLGFYGGNTTLTGAWDFSGGTATVFQGNLSIDGSLKAPLSTRGNNIVTLAGTLDGSLTLNGGGNTFILVGGSTLTGTANSVGANDTLGFYNMGTVDSSLLGTKYLNFENLGFFGGNTTLTGTWNFSTGTTTIYQGSLFIDGTLISGALDIKAGGRADINGTATIAGNTAVDGRLNVNPGGVLTTGSLDAHSTGIANIFGTATVNGTTEVDGLLNVNSGGVLTTGSLDAHSTGIANIFGTATVNETTTVDGLLNVNSGGVLTSGSLDAHSTGVANIFGTATVNGTTTVDGLLNVNSGGLLTTDTLTVNSGGTASILGTVNVDGATDIFGNLSLDGSLTTAMLTVERGGFLAGNGSIFGDVSILGTISPGHSIGTLDINGSLRFMPGSTYVAELTAGGSSDLIRVNGPVSIAGGTVAAYLPLALYTNGHNWHIITATGGIRGRFSSIDPNFTSYTVTLDQQIQGDSLDLVVVRTPYASFGATQNQMAAGSALDDILPSATGSMADLLLTMDFAMNPSQLSATLKGLNPEIYTAFPATGLAVAGIFTRMVNMRQMEVAAAATDKEQLWDVWGEVLGHRLDRDTENGISGYTLDTEGTVFGMDRALGQASRAGLIFGYSSSDLSFSEPGNSGQIDGRHIGFYGITHLGGFSVNGTAGYTGLDNGAKRTITTPVFATKTASSFTSNVFAGNLQGGYDFTFGSIRVGPTVSLDYQYVDQHGFSEKGGEDFAVRIKEGNAESLTGSIGLRLTDVIESGNWRFLPRAEAGLVHQFLDDAASLTCNFTGYPSSTFSVDGAEPDANTALAVLGVSAEYNKTLSLHLNFSATFAEQQNSQLLAGGLTWTF